ncbi:MULTISPECIES: EAL domain-containing protein [Peribacillus]|uniref:EAL domain-containing protein n=1 Tax=Peribacillus TaxID=2675229 RepID=UPI0024E22231|nr:EAL domain-containing protein [Peribacillus simplex]MDF9762591.1 EAL domain-containing protein (putative c-di-GMP-specific phosphodiesterase class I) [Peribacillus simplex]
MDTEKILKNLDRVTPFFQPIFSADQHQVIGYEILGRYEEQSEYKSLGSFFHDSAVPEEYRVEVDNYVLEIALERIKDYGEDFLIFINRDPNLLMLDHGEEFMEILHRHFQPEEMHRIVLELSDTISPENLDPLQHVLAYFKTYGIKIALDHLGQDTQLDRIAQISPNILKVNLDQLRISGGDAYQVILFSLSMLARKIGANLLFENIESEYQLRFAWKNGGRYYQGYFLAKPEGEFINKDLLREKFHQECQSFISLETKKLEAVYQKTSQFNENMQGFLKQQKRVGSHEDFLRSLAKKLDYICFRLYICDEEGYQKSPNILHKDGQWLVQPKYMNKNWSWRPYFLENIVKMRNEKKGILSDLYSDIETGETIRTFSYPLNDKEYIFFDLSYSYLYENEALL